MLARMLGSGLVFESYYCYSDMYILGHFSHIYVLIYTLLYHAQSYILLCAELLGILFCNFGKNNTLVHLIIIRE